MGFKVDFSEFDKMVKQYAQLEKEFNQFLQDFLIEMAERTISMVKPKTPKDTGKLRSAWSIGKITGNGKNLEIEILNDAEYATEVEFGHRGVYVPELGVTLHTDTRWTNGHFMLTTSIDAIDKQIPLRFEKKFKEFCKDLGIE